MNWVNAEKQTPENHEIVLLKNKTEFCRGTYYFAKEIECSPIFHHAEYDEKSGEYSYSAGYYEVTLNLHVDMFSPTHWARIKL